MRDRRKSIPPEGPPIDLSQTTEATRRAIYDAVVEIHFTHEPGEILAAKEAGEWYQVHTAEECGVQVAYLAGRWFVVWRQWDAPDDAPEEQQWEVLTVNAQPSGRFGIEFQEV
ncbi:MAG TPA: hypothetical protein VN375_19100 [Vicinamibacteria bacterium]|jgi:hypothetical protein|nr:hypothetical protein [Vicinamibacteria bacterium]